MKKLLLISLLCLPLSSNAGGIPVFDGVSLKQMITDNIARVKQWGVEAERWATDHGVDVDKMKELTSQGVELARQGEHYQEMVEGHYTFEDILNDPVLNTYAEMDGWKELYETGTDLNKLKEGLGIALDDNRHDNALKKIDALSRFYERSARRNQTLKDMLDAFEDADNPAKKADIANAIALEQTKIKNDEQMMLSMQRMADEQARLKHAAESRHKMQMLMGDGIPRTR